MRPSSRTDARICHIGSRRHPFFCAILKLSAMCAHLRMDSRRKRILFLFSGGVILGFFVYFLLILRFNPPAADSVGFGVTFSAKYAEELGLDWKQTYLATLDDLGVRLLRIPVYWDRVESSKGIYDWSEVDWMLDEAAMRGASVILTVGRKAPRWPECHTPEWARRLSESGQEASLMKFLEAEILHFKDARAITRWQVENEPLFLFGECPKPDRALLKREVDLVRGLDDRPIVVTDSGELSTWLRTSTLADTLGISMYRLVWNKHLGFLFWPLTPRFYSERIDFIKPLVDEVIISELQAEPWFGRSFAETPLTDQYDTMDIARFRGNVDFAKRTGASEVYLWGVEWWYWIADQGDARFIEEAKTLMR